MVLCFDVTGAVVVVAVHAVPHEPNVLAQAANLVASVPAAVWQVVRALVQLVRQVAAQVVVQLARAAVQRVCLLVSVPAVAIQVVLVLTQPELQSAAAGVGLIPSTVIPRLMPNATSRIFFILFFIGQLNFSGSV